MQIDDETLMALADGELDEATASALRLRVAADPELQARLHRFQETRRRLAALRQPQAGEDPLAAMIRAAAGPRPAQDAADPAVAPPAAPHQPHQPQPLRAEPRPSANLNRRPWRAAAASFALVALGLGWWEWADRPAPPAGLAPAELAALDALPSGQVSPLPGGGEIAMIASYRLTDGAFCREFETVDAGRTRTVLACRQGGDWTQRLAHGASAGDQDYRPASGGAALEQDLAALGATEPLDAEAEAQALRE